MAVYCGVCAKRLGSATENEGSFPCQRRDRVIACVVACLDALLAGPGDGGRPR